MPLVFDPAGWADLVPLAGVACPVHIRSGDSPTFDEDLLFTHRGLSGPAVLQASTFWRPDTPLSIDLFAGTDPNQWLAEERDRSGRLPLEACSRTGCRAGLPRSGVSACWGANWPIASLPNSVDETSPG